MEPEDFLKSFRLFVIPRFDEMFVDLLLAIIKVSVNEKSRVYRKKLQIANSNLFSPHCVMLDFSMVPQLVSIACMVTTKYKNGDAGGAATRFTMNLVMIAAPLANALDRIEKSLSYASYSWHMLFYWHGNSISVWKFN